MLSLGAVRLHVVKATIGLLTISTGLAIAPEKAVDACRNPAGCVRRADPRHVGQQTQDRCAADPADVPEPDDAVLHCVTMTPGETLTIHLRPRHSKGFKPIQRQRVRERDFWIFLNLGDHVKPDATSADLFIEGNRGTLSRIKFRFTG
ncbi:hypothetical protein Aiant_13430 [Actinoplanes ianthinogenes]|uniref:Uncharacterized protein n=2 Tax=Actinoplanes ianthinogenes TaxID=122358 RepID=A0ABN6C7L1_9ACTN|nr:hypothetical protein Aiant_13430 [Actinoplanes ianthinogenes]